MNAVLQIVQLALSLLQAHLSGDAQQVATIAGILVQIVQKANIAYRDQTGEPLDPSLIKPELAV